MSLIQDRPPNSRRALRRAVMIRCDVINPGWDRPVPCCATDLSPYGVHIEAAPRLSVGDQVMVQFRPPNARQELTLFAEVVRANDEGTSVGMTFLNATDEERETLELCLRGLPPPLPPFDSELPYLGPERNSEPAPILI